MSELIKHDAVVKEIKGDTIKVTFVSKAACISCQLRGICSASDIKEKEVILKKPKTGLDKYKIGETVNVVMTESQGVKALLWGYIFPFIVLLVVLFGVYAYSGNESLAGVIALASLIPYYFILYLFRNKLNKQFEFNLEN